MQPRNLGNGLRQPYSTSVVEWLGQNDGPMLRVMLRHLLHSPETLAYTGSLLVG